MRQANSWRALSVCVFLAGANVGDDAALFPFTPRERERRFVFQAKKLFQVRTVGTFVWRYLLHHHSRFVISA